MMRHGGYPTLGVAGRFFFAAGAILSALVFGSTALADDEKPAAADKPAAQKPADGAGAKVAEQVTKEAKAAQDAKAAAKEAALKAAKTVAERVAPAAPPLAPPAAAPAIAPPGLRIAVPAIRRVGVIRPGGQNGEGNEADPVFFPADRATMQRLTKAQELLEQKRFGEAVRLLGEILEGPEDYFFQPKRDEPIHRSLKSEAQRLIGQLPEEGRASYELQYGATAQQKLNVAIAAGDGTALAEVSRRFFHTKAGYEATNLLAGWQLDHGHPLAAALTFKRLQSAPAAADHYEPVLTVRMAACWSRAGMADKAAEALSALPQKYRDAKIQLGGKPVPIFHRDDEGTAWLAKLVGPPQINVVSAGDQWPMYRGVPGRNAVSAGSSPLLNRRWGVPTSDKDGAIEGMVKQLRQTALDQGNTLLPTLHPLAVNDHVFMRSIGGLVAINFATGKRVWRGPEDESVRQMLEPNAQFASVARPTVVGGRRMIPNTAISQVPHWLTQRIWNDTTYGTMSSDGQRIFCVEDLDVGTGVFDQRQIVMMNGRMPQAPVGVRSYNRLAAYDIATEGKLKWDIGGPAIDGGAELGGAFFLGPPLPLGGSVYALAEVKGEIRLVVLDAASGKLEWSQQLAVLEANIMQDPGRRSAGVSPSYSDGVLVCPTSAGAAVALDLTTRSLLWGYQYTRNEGNGNGMINGRVIMNGTIVMNPAQGTSRWSDSSVTIAEGYVLLAPPESNQLHCLSLVDGKLLWQRPREDGLYVGCVTGDKALIVGRSSVRALKLTDGSSAWVDTSLALPAGSAPSGRGFFNGKRYLLPLTSAEVAAIDVEQGRVVGRSKSRTGAIPGNLICYRGAVISQGVDVIERFDQRDDLWKQISETLEASPDDAEALARRGELLLDEGNFADAVNSLRRSFELQPKPHTRELLVDSMLEGLRVDFVANRGWLADVEKLVDQPQQRGTYLRLLAAGLQTAGEEYAAFEAYMRLVDAETQRSELERVDHVLSVRRDRWVQARLKGLMDASSPEERARMEAAIAARLTAANDAAGVAPLRQFLDFFSTLPVAETARDRLAQRLIEQRSLLEAELLLQYAERSGDARRAAAATARIAALVDFAGRAEEATLYYKRLTERFGDAEALDGKTGRQIVAALPEKSEALKLMNAAPAWPIGEVKRDEAKGQPGVRNPNFAISLVGPLGPFYEFMGLELDQQSQAIVGKDSLGRERWRVALRDPAQNNMVVFPIYPQTSQARVNGHVVLVSVGYQILAIDTLGGPGGEGARVLWRQDLVENIPGANMNFGGGQHVQVPWAIPRVVPMDPMGRPLGSMGPLTSNMASFQRLRNVVVVHPVSGETLWTRGNVEPGSDLFGDDEMLFIVAPNSDDALVVRALDGHELGRRKTPPSSQRMTTIGRRAVSWGVEDGKSVLKMTDVWEQKELWKWQFDQSAKPWLVADESVGVFAPDGRFLLISLADGKAIIDELVTPEPQLSEIYVLRSPDQYILIANHPWTNRNGVNLQPVPGIQMGNPMVAGNVHLFDRANGKKIASTAIDKQGLHLSQPAGLPLLTFATQIYNQRTTNQIRQVETEVKFLDKRTGRIVYEEKLSNQILAVDLIGDPERNQVVLKTPGSGVRLTFTGKPEESKAGDAKTSDGKTGATSADSAKQGEAQQGAAESDAARAGKAVARGFGKWMELVPGAVPGRAVPVAPRIAAPRRVVPADAPPAPAPADAPAAPAPKAAAMTPEKVKTLVGLLEGDAAAGPFGLDVKAAAAEQLGDCGQLAKDAGAIPVLTKLSKSAKASKQAKEAAVAALAKLNGAAPADKK